MGDRTIKLFKIFVLAVRIFFEGKIHNGTDFFIDI